MPCDLDALAGGEAGDGAEHRDPVVAVGVDRAAAQAAGARRSTIPSSVASTWPPSAVRAAVTVAIRSDSLRRSSAASRIVVVPSAKQAASATSGSSSIASGTSAPPTSVAAQRRRRGPAGRRSARRPRSPPRLDLDLGPHPLEDRQQAGAGRVDADLAERRPRCRRPAAPRRRRRRPRRGRRGRRSARLEPLRRAGSTTAPLRRARTVGAGGGEHPLAVVAARQRLDHPWSRPSASRPAKSRQDLTWALATGSSYSMPRSGAPATSQRRQAVLAAAAARRPSGAAAPRSRSTGRRRIESSPSSVHSPPSCPASQPGSSRSRVPALPTSIAAGRGAAQADAADPDAEPARVRPPSRAGARPFRRTLGAQRRHRGQGRARVGGVEVALDRRLPLRPSPRSAPRGGRSTCRRAGAGSRAGARRGRSGSSRARLLPGAEHGDRVAELADQRRARARPARRRRPRA